MFVINLTKDNLEYRAHGLVEVLKPGLNLVDNTVITSTELKNHFGGFITIVTSDQARESADYENLDIKEPIVPQEDVKDPEADAPEVTDTESDKDPEEPKADEAPEVTDTESDKDPEEPKAPVVEKKEVKAKATKAKAKSTKKK